MMRMPNCFNAIIQACINDKLQKVISLDTDSGIRYSKFIGKYGTVLPALLTLAPSYIEGKNHTHYNEMVSELNLRSGDTLDILLSHLGISPLTTVTDSERGFIEMYINHMSSMHKYYPLKVIGAKGSDTNIIENFIGVSSTFATSVRNSSVITFYKRSASMIASMFDYSVVANDISNSEIMITDKGLNSIYDHQTADYFLAISGNAKIPHYSAITSSMAQAVGYQIALQFTKLFSNILGVSDILTTQTGPKGPEAEDDDLDLNS